MRATTVVVRLCVAVSVHTLKGLVEARNRVHIAPRNSGHRVSQLNIVFAATLIATQLLQIALAPWRSGHWVPCIHGVRVAAKHCVCCRPWLQPLAAHCRHSFCTCATLLGLPHNAVQSCSILLYHVVSCNSLSRHFTLNCTCQMH